MYHSRGAMPSTGPNIDGGSHEGAGARDAAEQRRTYIAGTLADEFSIAVVLRPRHVIRDERCR